MDGTGSSGVQEVKLEPVSCAGGSGGGSDDGGSASGACAPT